MRAKAHVRPARVVFDGQSLNLIGQYPPKLMAQFPGVDWVNEAIGSQPWQTLSAWAQRVDRWANTALYTIYMMNGGSSNIFLNAIEPGTTAAAREATMAQGRKAAGFDYVLNITLTPYGGSTGATEAERITFNNVRKANTTDWSACVDLNLIPESRDPTNTTYYDALQLHWKPALGQLIANAVAPQLSAILSAVGA